MEPQAVNSSPVSNPAPASERPAVPTGEWPGAFGVFKYSKAAVGINVWVIVGLIVLSIAVNIILGMVFPGQTETLPDGQTVTTASPIANLLGNLVGVVLGVAMTAVMLAGVRREKVGFGAAFTSVKPMVYVKFVGLTIVTAFIAFVSLIALVIPFFFVVPRLVLAPYYLIDRDMGVIDSLKASWNESKGNVGKVYGIIGATILMALLCLTIIGIPVALYLLVAYSAAYVILYKYIEARKGATVTGAAA